ncbi:MAG: hypothetical protein AB9880_12105 [Christensenellales bacterium]
MNSLGVNDVIIVEYQRKVIGLRGYPIHQNTQEILWRRRLRVFKHTRQAVIETAWDRPQGGKQAFHEACYIVVLRVQRQPGRGLPGALDPLAHQRRLAKACRRGYQRQLPPAPFIKARKQMRPADGLRPGGRTEQFGKEDRRIHGLIIPRFAQKQQRPLIDSGRPI